MRRVIIESDNIVSPLGLTSAENWDSVYSGKTGLAVHKGAFGIEEPFCASLLDRGRIFEAAGRKGLGGRPLFETITLLSAIQAIEDSGINPESPDVGFILSSTKGNIDLLGIDDSSVPLYASAKKLAGCFGNTNSPLVVSNACISGLSAINQARRLLLQGKFKHIVVTGAECQSRFIVSGFQSLKALSSEPCKPFDKSRCGLNLGEAAATMVLTLSDAPLNSRWELVDGVTRNDANHISGPSRTGEGSYNCLRSILRNFHKENLAFVGLHGTSTNYNDEMESIALSRAGLSDVSASALKGYFGHTMGAAGILESIISMKAVEHRTIPAVLGFESLGVSCPMNISSEPRRTDKRAFIKLLSGFGGCNASTLFILGGKAYD